MPQEERKMEQFAEGESTREEIKNKSHFIGLLIFHSVKKEEGVK